MGMQCKDCGAILGEDGRCPDCGAAEEGRVRVMTRAEKMGYRGITLEEGAAEREEDIRFERHQQPWGKVRWTTFQTSASGYNRLIIGLLIAALLLFVFFVALPVALIIFVIGAAAWLLMQIFS